MLIQNFTQMIYGAVASFRYLEGILGMVTEMKK